MEDDFDLDKEFDEFSEEDDLDLDEMEPTDEDLAKIESAGFDDGYGDGTYDAGMFQGSGMSVDLDDLSDEEREAYEAGYMDGYEMGEDQRENMEDEY